MVIRAICMPIKYRFVNLMLLINSIYHLLFCLENIYKDLRIVGMQEFSLNGNVYEFSIDCKPYYLKIYLIFLSI